MSLGRQVVRHFVTARSADDPPASRPLAERLPVGLEVGSPPGVAVIASRTDAAVLGAAVGLALLARRSGAAIVCVYDGDSERSGPVWGRVPALASARGVAARLAVGGLDARVTGRLAIAPLPVDPSEAASAAMRAMAAADGSPVVLALGGPRDPAFEGLLEVQDIVLVVTGSDAVPGLVAMALEGLARRGITACACDPPCGLASRLLAASGLGLAPSLRRALSEPLRLLAAPPPTRPGARWR